MKGLELHYKKEDKNREGDSFCMIQKLSKSKNCLLSIPF